MKLGWVIIGGTRSDEQPANSEVTVKKTCLIQSQSYSVQNGDLKHVLPLSQRDTHENEPYSIVDTIKLDKTENDIKQDMTLELEQSDIKELTDKLLSAILH